MKIGIEKALTNVKEYLEQNNHETIVMNDAKTDGKRALRKYDAIVVSGMDSNFLGIQDTLAKTPVVTANGKTPEEVYREIQSKLQ